MDCKITRAIKKERPMSRGLCLSCKGGKLLCGRSSCPLLKKISVQEPVEKRIGADVFGPSPSIFVGWGGYPQVSVGQMTSISPGEAYVADDPGSWYGLGFDDIISIRSNLVRSKKKEPVRSQDRFVSDLQEIALSVRAVDVESHFLKKPEFSVSFNPVSQPMGPTGLLDKMDVASNPVIPRKVDSIVNDELKSAQQVGELFNRNFDVYYLTGVLSSGVLGLNQDAKMVPTRWSITAVDDMLGKQLMQRIRDYPEFGEFTVYSNEYLGNHFEVLVIPGRWEFEMFEAWCPDTLWTAGEVEPVIQAEYEGFEGRSKYAFNEGGGYYAGRFAVTEAMDRMRRQGRVIVFREIYDSYVVPVGVWEVRENVRKAMDSRPRRFADLKSALKDVQERLTIPISNYLDKSEILTQKKITDYIRY